jgi:hypothetical protein
VLYDENRFLIRGQQGDGAGFVMIEERGLVVTLPHV